MPFLTIDGITVPVSVTAATQQDSETIGDSERAYAGNLRTSIRDEKRVWQFETTPLETADVDTLTDAIALGVFVDCAGDALGETVECQVRVTGTEYVQLAGGFRRKLALKLREV